MPQVTIKNLAEAIRQNGLPKAKYSYFGGSFWDEATGACALGQAAINLNADVTGLATAVAAAGYPIANWNDTTDMTLPEIADKLEAVATGRDELDRVIEW